MAQLRAMGVQFEVMGEPEQRTREKPGTPEEDFLQTLLKMAHLHGWKRAHFRPARTATGWRTAVSGDGKGFPDVLLLKNRKLIVSELKYGKNKPSAEQLAWLDSFKKIKTIETNIWYPTDWDKIQETLEK